MNLKKELGSRYSFERLYDENRIVQLRQTNPSDFAETTVASLVAGCLKLDAVLYRAGGRMLLGYDVYVKDNPGANEWICYDNLTDTVSLDENDMCNILNCVAERNGLSYTDSSFEVLNGKMVKAKNKPSVTNE